MSRIFRSQSHRRFKCRVPLNPCRLQRVCLVYAALRFHHGIFGVHVHFPAGIDRAVHVRIGFRIYQANGEGGGDIARVGRLRGELTSRKCEHIRISAGDDRGVLPDVSLGFAGELAVRNIQLRGILCRPQLHLPRRHTVLYQRIGLEIILGVEAAVIHIHVGLRIGYADGEPHAQNPEAGAGHRGSSVGGDGNIPMLLFACAIADGFHVGVINIHVRFRMNLGDRRDGSVFYQLIFKETDAIFESRRDFFVGLFLAFWIFRQRTVIACPRQDVDVVPEDFISSLRNLLAHVDGRIGAVTDVPGVESGLRRGVNGHVAGLVIVLAAGVQRGGIHRDGSHAHGSAGGGDLDVPALLILGAGVDVGFLDGNHAAVFRPRWICLVIGHTGGGSERNLPAVRVQLPAGDEKISFLLGSEGNIAAVRFQLAADIHALARDEDDAVLILRCLRGGGDAVQIDKGRAIAVRRGTAGRKRVKHSAGAKDCIFRYLQHSRGADGNAVLRVHRAVHGDGRLAAVTSRRIRQGFQRLAVIVRALEHLGAQIRIGAQGETAHVEHTVRADSDAVVTEEIHIAANLPILERIDHAVDVDLVVHHIDLVLYISQLEICHVTSGNIKINEPVQCLIVLHLLVLDVVLGAAGNIGFRHRAAVLRILHRHVGIGHPAAEERRAEQRKSPKRFPASGRRFFMMTFHQLRGDHIGAPSGVPDDFIYFIHGMASYERKWVQGAMGLVISD